jgi:guanosine-3',5'-bis(diphosphate) 3'-pyrophosphohydrolase
MAFVITKALLGESAGDAFNSSDHAPLAIRGSEGLVLTYGKCCRPIPGDPIVGHVSPGKGIVVHIEGCGNLHDLRNKPEELTAVQWDPNVEEEFSVELRVELEHEKGIIATLASTIAAADANIERMNMLERDAALSTVNIVLAVRDRVHLAAVIKRLRTIRSINKITRSRS